MKDRTRLLVPRPTSTMDSAELKTEKTLQTVRTVEDAESDRDFRDKDEALRLVGLERTAVFSEEHV